jgi:RNA methyltransferase, TrmH family
VREALAEPAALTELFATADAEARHGELLAAAATRGVPVHRVSGEILGTLAQTVTPQGLVGVAPFRDVPFADILAARPRLVVVLAQVRDPGNAGTVLRAADAAGADAVVFTEASVDPYNGKCVRASAGSLFHLPIAVGVPGADAVGGLRRAGLRVVAADRRGPVDLDELVGSGELAGPTAWLFGNEAWGLAGLAVSGVPERDLVDVVVRVPIHGRAESLNLATAAAVCLYASARAQRTPDGCRRGQSRARSVP